MSVDITTILLGLGVACVAVLYAAPKGYLGTRRRKDVSTAMAPPVTETLTPATEQVVEVPTAESPAVAEPAPSTATPMYESVQPPPAPVTYTAPSTTSFGSPTIAKKPTRTYRRRTAPQRSTTSPRSVRSSKPKKR